MRREWMVVLAAVGMLTVTGCMPDAVKMFEVQAKQQNALLTSIADKVQWENVAAVIASQIDDPELLIEVMYAQGVQIRISARGVESSVSLNAMGAGTGPNDAETARQINAILNSTLPASVKEQLIADLLQQLLHPPEPKPTS